MITKRSLEDIDFELTQCEQAIEFLMGAYDLLLRERTSEIKRIFNTHYRKDETPERAFLKRKESKCICIVENETLTLNPNCKVHKHALDTA